MSNLKFYERDYKNEQLMQLAEQVHAKMGEQIALFPKSVGGLSNLHTALVPFRHAAAEAIHRDSRAIKIRNRKRQELICVLKELAKYVDTVARDDDAVVLAAGFDIRKGRTSYRAPVPKAQRPTTKAGQIGSGRISLRTTPWPGARLYWYRFRPRRNGGEWSTQLSSKSYCTIEGLKTFKEYEFRVSFIGIDPTPNFSDTINCIVL